MMKGVTDMKKLIAILLPLLVSASALAEDIGVIGSADGPTSIIVAETVQPSLLGKGLIVTAGGLCGVFLVLILFFFTIKLLQKVLK